MKLSELSIKRPVFAAVMSVALILLGVISFLRLPVREYPDIDPPIVSVVTFYRGASPNVVETEITDVLEEQFATIEGVKTITSSSQEQGSAITIEFELSRDVDVAANDVRDRVSRVRGQLPREAEDPVVEKVDVNAQPIMWLAFGSETYSTLELSDVADRVLKERLQRLPGVGSVFIGGERRYSMRVWLDHQAHGRPRADHERRGSRDPPRERRDSRRARRGHGAGVRRADARRVADAGGVRGDHRHAGGRPAGAARRRGRGRGRPRGRAHRDPLQRTARDRPRHRQAEGGEHGRGGGRSSATRCPVCRPRCRPACIIDIAYDSAAFIEESLEEVEITLLIATGLVVLVVLLFLKSLRATLIPIVAIPIAIIGTFTVAYAMGFTVNIITLLALVLAIGLVVDDAIVVLENCFRHLEMGKSRKIAARDGVNEIAFAVIATTIALVAVFIPVAFLTGAVGRLFREFGITLAVSVAISGFVALTLTPTLCALILRRHSGTSDKWSDRSFDAFFRGLDRAYGATLRLDAAPPRDRVRRPRWRSWARPSGSTVACRANWCPPRTAAPPSASSSPPKARRWATRTSRCARSRRSCSICRSGRGSSAPRASASEVRAA